MAKVKAQNVASAVAVGTIQYKGRILTHRWISKQAMVVAVWVHQGFIIEKQLEALYPGNSKPANWVSWANDRAKPTQKFGCEVSRGKINGEDAAILKGGANEIPWVAEHPMLAPVLKMASGTVVVTKEKRKKKPVLAAALPETLDELEELESQEDE